MNETPKTNTEEIGSSNLEAFQQKIGHQIKEMEKGEHTDSHLENVDPKDLDLDDLVMQYGYDELKNSGFNSDKVKRFEGKLLKVQESVDRKLEKTWSMQVKSKEDEKTKEEMINKFKSRRNFLASLRTNLVIEANRK
jgi:hypothetical protein